MILEKDVFELIVEDIKFFDVVVNVFGVVSGQEYFYVEVGRVLINILKNVKNIRLFVVGGVGSLFVDEDKIICLMDILEFLKEYLLIVLN